MQQVATFVFNTLLAALALTALATWAQIIRRLWRGGPLVAFKPRELVPWTGWDVLVLFFLDLAIEGASLVLLRNVYDIPAGEMTLAVMATVSMARLVWLLFAVLYLVIKSGAFGDDLGLNGSRLRADVLLGFKTFLATLLPVYGVQIALTTLLDMPSEHPLVKLVMQHGSLLALSVAAFVAVVVATIVEEFMFRVLLQGWLEKLDTLARQRLEPDERNYCGLLPAVIVSVLFGLMHLGHGPDPVAVGILSLFLGYLYNRTHRIFPSLVVHVCINSTAIVQLWFMVVFGVEAP